MSKDQWTTVDHYLTDLLAPADPVLEAVLRESNNAGLPPINVAPNQGKLLHLLALGMGARNVLEIGTLGGYSTIWLARALPPGGRVITLEADAKHATLARSNFARAGVSDAVELILGRAIDTLPTLEQDRRGPFDLIFIDADKVSTADYFAWAVRLSRRGSVIIVDNVIRKGEVTDAASTDANVQGVRRLMEAMAREPSVSATALQTVGIKGYDGFAMAVVTG